MAAVVHVKDLKYPPQSHFGRATSPPLTADKTNHWAVGTLHLHCSATCFLYVTLHCPFPPRKNCPFHWGYLLPLEKNHPPVHQTHHPERHNWCIYTELLLLL